MGVVGSLLAHTLRRERIKFSWSDTEEQHTAWQACTGAVYPTGEPWEYANYLHWTEGNYLNLAPEVDDNTELAVWCYNSKNPPHRGADVGIENFDEVGPIVVSNGLCRQFNMQEIVKATRIKFAKRRTDSYDGKGPIIVTHGSAQADTYVWGWSVQCRLDFSAELAAVLAEQAFRPTFYFRQVYDMSYLYPCPGREDLWYGGTATVSQKQPSTRGPAVVEGYKRFRTKVEERSAGHVTVAGGIRSSLVEGWRPKVRGDLPLARELMGGKQILLRPMGGNGVRYFPLLADAVLELL